MHTFMFIQTTGTSVRLVTHITGIQMLLTICEWTFTDYTLWKK